uniref:Transmembrane protein 144b n=1 Tax=Amphilophus citrinellus TaxID=61819 RepID=A0A3Q0QYV7_AMPCI
VAAVLLYGSNFVPVKRVETGDGMFFQWVTCAAIWVISMIGDLVLQSPKFCPFAMLGGVLWATGNIAVVPFIKAIGLGLGILISGSSTLMLGWASSRFGWFGIAAQNVSRPILNYCGAGLCLLSGLIFFFVKADVKLLHSSETIPLLTDRVSLLSVFCILSTSGSLLAAVVGFLYAFSIIPVLYIKSHSVHHDSMFYEASVYELDYVHAHCCGIFIASTVYFAIYCAAMNTKPKLYSRAVLPGLLSGLMWTLGTYCWFLANNYLTSIITFPIVTAGCGLVAALWGCLVN